MAEINKIQLPDGTEYDLKDTTSGYITNSDIPVTSVNNQTGAVVLNASDVGALPDSTSIPTATSDLTNDSGFITASDIPVNSVNGKTGAVTLSASDVDALPDSTTFVSGVKGNSESSYRSGNVNITPANLGLESKTAASGGTDVSLVTTGEKYTWNNKLSSHQTIKIDGITGATSTRYATCSTAAATAAKTANVTAGTFSLATGSVVYVKFTNSNTVANPTLNINSTGAKAIMRYGTTAVSTTAASSWRAGAIVGFIYDGTNWVEITGIDDNTTYSSLAAASGGTATSLVTTGEKYTWNNKLSSHQTIKIDGVTGATSTRYATCATAAATAAKTASITTGTFALETGATVYVKFTYSNTVASPTLNVNSTGAKSIMRYGTTAVSTSSATSWNAGAVVGFTYDGTNWVMHDWLNNNTTTGTTYAAASVPNNTTFATQGSVYNVNANITTVVNTKLNRSDASVNTANTSYSTAMARAIYAGTTDMTAGTTSLTSGVIYLYYEA